MCDGLLNLISGNDWIGWISERVFGDLYHKKEGQKHGCLNRDRTQRSVESIQGTLTMYCHSNYGPCFGFNGNDIYIYDNSNISNDNYSILDSYQQPENTGIAACEYLAGAN